MLPVLGIASERTPLAPRGRCGAAASRAMLEGMNAPAPRRLPLLALLGLALLGIPRVVLHDLDLLHEGTAVNMLFVAVPPLVWIAVAVWRRVDRPFTTLLLVGLLHGAMLVLAHQLLWNAAFDGTPPRLGGNLADLDPALQAVILRAASVPSGLVTGALLGAVTGAVAWVLSRWRRDPLRAR